jgi:two-component system chemotaxis response regulator CheB
LPAVHATQAAAILPGHIYIAPPSHHMLPTRDGIQLVRGPRENGHCPAADPMFRSAALAFGQRVIGVVLSGSLDDGTAGLAAVKRASGLAVVQDPHDALFPSMPQSAIDHVAVDCITPIDELARVLSDLMTASSFARDAALEMRGPGMRD